MNAKTSKIRVKENLDRDAYIPSKAGLPKSPETRPAFNGMNAHLSKFSLSLNLDVLSFVNKYIYIYIYTYYIYKYIHIHIHIYI